MTFTQIHPQLARHLVLIDIENLVATSSPTKGEVAVARANLRSVVPDLEEAQCIVACSHHAAPAVAFEFYGARHLWKSGPDGADLALLSVLTNERVEQRFGRVTLCSGDGIFSESVAWLASERVEVTVVALAVALAVRLQLAARSVIEFPSVSSSVNFGSAS